MYKLSQVPEEYKKKLITAEQAAASYETANAFLMVSAARPRMISISKSVNGQKNCTALKSLLRPLSKTNRMRHI